MIEKQIPLEIAPGLAMNGSLMERQGRWINGNHVRFPNGIATPMGADNTIGHSGTPPAGGGPAKAMYIWWSDDNGATAVVGEHTKMFVVRSKDGFNEVTDITPVAGISDEGDVNSWSFTNLGQILLFTPAGLPSGIQATWDIYKWDPSTPATPAVAVGGSPPTVVRGVFVTPENFLVALDSLNSIRWASQGTYDVWTAGVGNTAGSLDVPSPSMVVAGRPLIGESLLWTTTDLWSLTYVGGTLVYGLRKIGDHGGLLGANNIAINNGVARWMGVGGFFEYDGYVRPLECPLSEYIFGDINLDHAHRFFTVQIPQFNAIQFWYFSTAVGDYADRYVEYNYANNTWTKGEGILRAAGIGEWPIGDHGSYGTGATSPLFLDSTGTMKVHEQLDLGVLGSPYLESGPMQLDDGNLMTRVQKIIPDAAAADDDITLYAGDYPGVNGSGESTFGPYAVIGSGSGPIDTRFTARYVRYKQTLENGSSRVGIPRLGVIPGGSR